MGKLRQTALILGEGPTEFFYFKSLCDVFKRLTLTYTRKSCHFRSQKESDNEAQDKNRARV